MQNALKVLQKKQTMSSLEIAKLTEKDHDKILVDIRSLLDDLEIGHADFRGSYKSKQNKDLPCFNLHRRECDILISGYSVKYRAAIVDRWQELEQEKQFNIPKTFPEALRLAADLSESLNAANLQIEQDKPKVDFAMAVRNMQGACSVGDFAKTIGYGRNKFFKMIREDGILIKNNVPYQKYIDMGCFVVIEQIPYTDNNGKTHPAFTTMITGKGQVFLEKKYRKDAV
jgi:phage antirepressor YoqD-like protein